MNRVYGFFLSGCISCLVLIISLSGQAQAPDIFKYQAIARDSTGQILKQQQVGLRVCLLKSSHTGEAVYCERHDVITNEFGLLNIGIGNGTVEHGNMGSIDWGGDDYFVRIEMDEEGGTDYQLMGVAQLLSVPYALYAENVNNLVIPDTSATNELQSLAYSKDTLFIVPGNYVVLQDNVEDADADPTNELQTLDLSGTVLSISNGNSVNLSVPNYWQKNGDNIYYNDGYVGIGLTNPQWLLDIAAPVTRFHVKEKWSTYSNAWASQLCIGNTEDGGAGFFFDASNGDFIGNDYGSLRQKDDLSIELTNRALQPIRFGIGDMYSSSHIKMTIQPNGNVGIGYGIPHSKLHITDGDVYIDNPYSGIIMKSPDGNCWRMTMGNNGKPVFTQITCP